MKDIEYVYDHKGNKFKSEREMCKFWNVNYSTYLGRKQRNWTLEECLEGRWIYDHKGNKFKFISEMCKFWNIDYNTYISRKRLNWLLEECLEGKKDIKYVYDHKGNKFKSEREMCKFWNIDCKLYFSRKYLNWPLEECLGLLPHISIDNHYLSEIYLTDNLYLEKIISDDYDIDDIYCLCRIDNNPVILHKNIVLDICKKYNDDNSIIVA